MITEKNKKAIEKIWYSRKGDLSNTVANDIEIEGFINRYGEIPEDYLWFIKTCGGGVVGSEWIDGITDLHSTHDKFNKECNIPNGYTIGDSFVIGWDGAGNPIAIHPDGKVISQWHDSGDIVVLSESFEKWLQVGLGVT